MPLIHQQGLVLGSRHSPIAPAPFLCVDCLCSSHRSIDGNNFFQLLEEVGEPAACPGGCFSLALPFLRFRLQRPFPPTPIPSQQHFSSCASLVDGVSRLLKSCVSMSPSIVLSCIICPCDGNVLVNCITDLLCVHVCLWGWFIVFCWSLDPFVRPCGV